MLSDAKSGAFSKERIRPIAAQAGRDNLNLITERGYLPAPVAIVAQRSMNQ